MPRRTYGAKPAPWKARTSSTVTPSPLCPIPRARLYKVLTSSRAAMVSKAGSSLTFCSATCTTASSSCSEVMPSNSVISSSDCSWVARATESGRPRAASSIERAIS